MYAVGFAAVLAGGCPLRQLVLAGQGSSDSAVSVLGLFVGAAVSHNFGLAGAEQLVRRQRTSSYSRRSQYGNGQVAVIICIVVCFIIAFTNKRRKNSQKPKYVAIQVEVCYSRRKDDNEMKEVDARGLSCPEPIMLTAEAIKGTTDR